MFPLQTGDLTTTLMIATGIIFFAVVVILVLYAVRRSTSMSEELSTQWEEKLRTIKPTATPQTNQPPRDRQPSLLEQRPRDSASYTMLQAELRESKTRIQNCLQEIVTIKQNEMTVRREIQNLKTEVTSLQERLRTSRDELKELRTSIDESAKPDKEAPSRDLPTLNAQPVERSATLTPQERKPSSIFGNLFQRKVCLNCGRRLGSKDKYCDSCGRLVPTTS